jgi:hypothetical protein
MEKTQGRFLPTSAISASGFLGISKVTCTWNNKDGKITVASEKADLNVTGWTRAHVLDLSLSNYGNVQADFELPSPARIPAAVKREGPVATPKGKAARRGLVRLLPRTYQESRGQVSFEYRGWGTFDTPVLTGKEKITRAGLFSVAGINIEADSVVELAQDRIIFPPCRYVRFAKVDMQATAWMNELEDTEVYQFASGKFSGSVPAELHQGQSQLTILGHQKVTAAYPIHSRSVIYKLQNET